MTEATLERRLGYSFNDLSLLRQALTHRSHGTPNNERLEFLGDGLLNFVVAGMLFERFPKLPEGDLSRLRASLVNQHSLAEIAGSLELGDQLRLGEGELKSGGFRRPSILADALEAVIGAIFLDGGFAAAEQILQRLYDSGLKVIDPNAMGKDPKTMLQEVLQGRRLALPQYSVIDVSGEAHEQHFRVECAISELAVRTLGEGSSRRAAEQQAAKAAFDRLAESK